jgi:hypothetical protein
MRIAQYKAGGHRVKVKLQPMWLRARFNIGRVAQLIDKIDLVISTLT